MVVDYELHITPLKLVIQRRFLCLIGVVRVIYYFLHKNTRRDDRVNENVFNEGNNN